MNIEKEPFISVDDPDQSPPTAEQEAAITNLTPAVVSASENEAEPELSLREERSPHPDTLPSLKYNAAFPTITPAILQVPEAKLRQRAALLGMALGIVTSVLLFLLAPKGSMVAGCSICGAFRP